MNVVVLGAGTAGLISALMMREKYPLYNVTVVKSGEIGIIGVGEGSTEHWIQFMSFIGIDLLELIHKTKATVKIGILFKNWNLDEEYVHTVGEHYVTALNRLEAYNHLYLNNPSNFACSPNFENIFYKNKVPYGSLKVSNQFHFDTFKLNNFLLELCQSRNISFIDTTVNDIILSENGNVTTLISDIGNIEGDFFIDCSGFKRVISSKLGCKWVSKSEFLPMNHAIAFPTEFTDPKEIEPYTASTALSAGWSWKIPTQERYGNGYVFCDEYINADQAQNEIGISLGKNIEKVAKDIKFNAGRIDKFWCKNVVSVGLAGSFAEPLEAQSIGFTIIQLNCLLEFFDSWPFNKTVSHDYNVQMINSFDNTIDYLQLHYLCKRGDTKFWKDKPFELTPLLENNLEQFKLGNINPSLFDGKHNMFRIANFYQVLAGLKLIDKSALLDSLQKNRPFYNESNGKAAQAILENSKNINTISHYEYLNTLNQNYLDRQ
jgi:tryptophan halogenase